ncbi:MAG: flippase-like domain-containing protein, partial [Actinomycetia bacterium]|nr:flippase-like domain-containing protein [Actinomycetes bacterium]
IMKRKLTNVLRIVISLSLLTFLVYRNRGNFANIVEASKDLNVYYLIIAFIFYFTAISFIVFRWGTLLKAHNIFISNRFLWQSALIGFFYNNLLPSSAGGDFYRVYDIKQNKSVPVNEGIASVVMERVIGTLSSIILLIVAYFIGLFNYFTRNAALGLIVSGLVIILFFIALFFPRLFKLNLLLNKFRIFSKIRPRLKEFHVILIGYRHKIKYLVISFLFTMLIQVFFFISYNSISLALGLELRFYVFIFIIPFVSLVSSVPVTIGGIGIRENALVFAVTSFGIAQGQATLFSLILLAIILIIGMIGGIIYLFKNILYRSKSFI